jgi:hypothetical protein
MLAGLLFVTACHGEPHVPVVPAVPPVAEPPDHRVRASLVLDKPVDLPEIGATATLLASETAMYADAAGQRSERVQGRVRLVRGDHTDEVAFVEGQGFDQWGGTVVIFGDASDLELSWFPPGVLVKP